VVSRRRRVGYLGTTMYLPALRSREIDCSLYDLMEVIHMFFLLRSKLVRWHSPSLSFQIDTMDFLSPSVVKG